MIIALIILVLLVIAGIYVWKTYNKMVSQRINVETSFAQIEVQLKRRHDLIPNLVETVRGYAAHENKTFTEVTEARAAAMSAADNPNPQVQSQAEGFLGMALGRLMAVAEAYPDLKATTNFQQLSAELSNTEQQIAITRQVYNDTVNTYNTTIQMFPGSVIAGMFHFDAKEFYDAPDEVNTAPVVDFSTPPSADTAEPTQSS